MNHCGCCTRSSQATMSKISTPLFLAACLWTIGLSKSFDKGINRIFKFSFTSSDWTFETTQDLSGNQSCHFNVTNDGILYYGGGSSYCYFNPHSLRVIAANSNLRVNVSFSIMANITVQGVVHSIPHAHINIDAGTASRELHALKVRLGEILPIELIKTNPSAVVDSRISDLCPTWDDSTPVWKCQIKHGVSTDILVLLHLSTKAKHRYKRQLFSNLHNPVFVGAPYTVSIHEEIDLAAQVIQIAATDEDEGSAGEVTFSLHADVDQRSLDVFLIDPVSGWVTTNGRVDREDIALHQFTVRARDQGSPANSARTTLTIIVEDFNDHAPTFEQPIYNINVSETRTVNSTITRVRADDSDIGNNKVIVYSVVNAAQVTDFTINARSGDLSIARALNRENTADYSFVVKAEDQPDNVADRLSTTVVVNVLVLDYNDNSPKFTQSDYTVNVREDLDVSSGPQAIDIISATDLDAGSNGQISYSITSGNPVPAVFHIASDTGELRVITQLDRDVVNGEEYNLRVKARDGGVPALHSVVSVKVIVEDVNDNPPSFRYDSYRYTIPENNNPGDPIATIEATDPDEGNNKLLVYSIVTFVQGTQLPITINSETGVITNTVELDRETTSRYEFMVRVEDSGDIAQHATANVTLDILDVNDNKPEFGENIYTMRISEDTAPPQEVITVTAVDPDENDVITYSIVSGDPNEDFVINKEQQYGVIRVNKALSYDRQSFYRLKVRAVDQSQKLDECIVKVNVTDKNRHPPVFIQGEYTFHISEAVGTGASIGQVQAEDQDIELNGKLVYFFTSTGQPLPFMINPSNGEITVNDTLDRDNPLTSSFYVDVFARDHGLPPLQTEIPAVVHIVIDDVNDNAPRFEMEQYTAIVLEDKSTGSSVITLSATDMDQPGTLNSQVQYTFDGGNDGNGSFYIEQAGGTIRVNHALDRERVDEYNLVVFATDMAASDRLSSSVNVLVTVLDVNDNSPEFESEIIVRRILENKPIRSTVQPPIRATDADLGDNAKVTFQLVGGDEFAFELQDQGDSSFILYSKVSLDYESLRKNFTLEVQASSEHMITKAKVVVKLQDVNDNSPELKDFAIIINNYDNHFPDGVIGQVPAFDPDESDRSSLVYTVKSGNEANFFTLNSATGDIILNKALGSDRPTGGEFVIQVSDVLNKVNATCRLVYRLITDDMLENSVTLRLDDMTAQTFMTSMYVYTVQALAEVLRLIPSQIYFIDIKDDTEVDTDVHNSVLNVSFAAVQQINSKDVYLDQDHIKEQIYRKLDLLKNLSAVTILPFDDTLCVKEPCLNYQNCSITLEFAEAVPFIHSEAMLFRPIRTKTLYSCTCPQGFGGQNLSYTCDTEINLCYSNPCMNSATCQQVEAGYRCLCPAGFKGERCQYDTNNGQFNNSDCPNKVCNGPGSYCLDLIKGGFACHSVAGRCEETESHTDTCALRTATFLPNSYLMFPALNSRARFHLQVSFASRRKSALLLYNGRYNHQHDFVALQLINHSAVFTMSFGGESYSISVGKQYGLNDGQWHTINIDYSSWILTISLDQCDVGLSLAHPEFFSHPCAGRIEITECKGADHSENHCYLDLTGPLLVGGLPGYLDIDRLTYDYFEGCMRDLYVNFEHVDFNSAVTNHNTQEGCVYKTDSCINMPCRNQGTCVSSWGTYRCVCPEERSGKDCSMRTGPPYTYYGLGYVKYTTGLNNVQKPWYNSFVFKTTVDNRPLLRIDLEQGKTIEYRLEGGYVTFRYGSYYYLFDEAYVNDDSWHHFELRLISNSAMQGQILFQLDYGEIQRSEPLDNSLDGLSVLSVWVGGAEGTNDQNPGFSGCIKDVMLEDSLGSPAEKSYAVEGCVKPVTCGVICTIGTSVCEVDWETSTCQCNEGLIGPKCSSICSSQYSPCENEAQCVVDRGTRLGYQCECNEQYQGAYCEEKRQTQCPASWWGSPVCGPCNCSAELNYNSQCDRRTGECVCKSSYYKPSGSDRCQPCNCYYSPTEGGGALSSSCDQQTGQCSCVEGVGGKRCDECTNPFAEVTARGCKVQYDSCPKNFASDVWWTRTKFGVLRIESCPPGSVGNATRICKDNVEGWLIPDLTGCTSTGFISLNRSLVDLEERQAGNSSVPIHTAGLDSYVYRARKIVSELKNSTDQLDTLYSNDLLISAKILREILLREKTAKSFNLTYTKDRYFIDNLVQVTSRILRPSLTSLWVNLLNTSQPTLLVDLLQDYDDYIANLADNMATMFVSGGMEPFQVVSDNMVMGLDTLRKNGYSLPKYNNIKKEGAIFDEVTSVQLPDGLFTENSNKLLEEKAVGGYILYNTAGTLFGFMATKNNNPYASDVSLYNQPIAEVRSYGGVAVNSPVFSLVLQQGTTKLELNDPIEITFQLTDNTYSKNPQCVYLNSELKWTSEYCVVKAVRENEVLCSCTHMSTYALITDFTLNTGLSKETGVHTYVATAIALCCLLFTLLVFICLKDLKSNYIYNQINIQLCFSIALIVYISGSNSYTNQGGCTVVAVLLNFFVLSLFAWIFVNALHLYRILTEKRHIDGEAMLLYVIIGYVGPGIVTGLSVGLSPEDFGSPTLCWLDITRSMVWSLAGPLIFCCIAVGSLLAFSIIVTCKEEQRSNNITTARKNDAKNFKSAIWVAIVFMPLTAFTWLFGLLSVNSLLLEVESYDYMFSAFACITAIFSLFAHVILNKRSREELRRRWKSCQGHGTLEESDASDKPNNMAFNELNNMSLAGMFAAGSESSTTSNSRLTSVPSNDIHGYRRGLSSTSSDIPTYSQYGRARARRRASDLSSDSETDSEIRTEREKDIELASSHSSDEDEGIQPIVLSSISPVMPDAESERQVSKPLSPLVAENEGVMMSTFNQDVGFAPPPPYFVTPSDQWSSRISESTSSTHGSQSNTDGLSVQSSYRNQLTDRPDVLPPFSRGSDAPRLISDLPSRVSPTQYNQHINTSYLNSPSPHDQMTTFGRPPATSAVVESHTSSLQRLQRGNSGEKHSASRNRTSPANQCIDSPINLPRASPIHQQGYPAANHDMEFNSLTNKIREDIIADSDSVHTQSTVKSHHDDVFMPPPPPDLSLHLTQPVSDDGVMLVETDLDLLNDVNNETQV